MIENSFVSFNGLRKAHPLLAFVTTVFLFSLAGIPLTGGFFAKYYMLSALVKAGAGLWLVMVAVVFAAISIYYYFKIVQAMYFATGESALGALPKNYAYKLLALAILLLVLGVFPNLLLNYLYF